jgi:hypothetical protein
MDDGDKDGNQRPNNVVTYTVPSYVDANDARVNMQIRPYKAYPSKSTTDCPLTIEAYYYSPMDGDWVEVRGDLKTQIDELNYSVNDPHINFSLTQFEYVNEFAPDFNYMQSGPVPPVT